MALQCKMCKVLGTARDFNPQTVEVQYFGLSFLWRVCWDCSKELAYGHSKSPRFTLA